MHLINIGKLGTDLSYHLKWNREHSDQNVVSEEISNATQQAEIDLNIEKETTETNKDDNLIQKFNANTAVDDFIFMCFFKNIISKKYKS